MTGFTEQLQNNHPDPVMGRGYIRSTSGRLLPKRRKNVRATGGAVASFPYRGRPWMGWMFLCFFLCAKESKKFCKVEPCKKGFRVLPY